MKNVPFHARYITESRIGTKQVELPEESMRHKLHSYGYRYSGGGDIKSNFIHGSKGVDPVAASIVERIFQMYADGLSPHQIAATLNAEGVPAPPGSKWRDTVIRGHAIRGTGILNNRLYIGEVTILGHPEPVYVPGLRIVSDELWRQVKERQDVVHTYSSHAVSRSRKHS